jgi:hypothetical protein
MKKVKRFQEGGYEDTDDYKNLTKAQAREDANAAEPGTETTAAFMKRTGTKAYPPMSRTFTSKGPIVTKEQMKKAGFDNLRDYLNAERGLTRRSDKSTANKETAKSESKAPTSPRVSDTGEEASRLSRRMPNPVPSVNLMNATKGTVKLGEANLRKGGTVSSASKRADGIATRGKTKGRMV